MVNFKLYLYFSRGGWGGAIIKLKAKANLSSTGTGLPTGTELGNKTRLRFLNITSFYFFVLMNELGFFSDFNVELSF